MGTSQACDRGDRRATQRSPRSLRQPFYLWFAGLLRRRCARLPKADGGSGAPDSGSAGRSASARRRERPAVFGAQIFAMRREQGRLAEMEPAVRGFVEQFPLRPGLARRRSPSSTASLDARRGARASSRSAGEGRFRVFPATGTGRSRWRSSARSAHALGDTDGAPSLYEHAPALRGTEHHGRRCRDCYGSCVPVPGPAGHNDGALG